MKTSNFNLATILFVSLFMLTGCQDKPDDTTKNEQIVEPAENNNVKPEEDSTNVATPDMDTVEKVSDYNYSEKSLKTRDIHIKKKQDEESNQESSEQEESQQEELRFVQLEVTPSKKEYAVGEPITFTVKGNEDYFLYVNFIKQDTQESVRLIPNADTKDYYMLANKEYTIPNTVEFYSDKAGTERLVFIGSNIPIPDDNMLKEVQGKFAVTKIVNEQSKLSRYSEDYARSLDPKTRAIQIRKKSDNPQDALPNIVDLKIY